MRVFLLAAVLGGVMTLPALADVHPVHGAVHGTVTAGKGVARGAGQAGRGVVRGTVTAARGVGRGAVCLVTLGSRC